jgi:hypothetical protein
MLIVVRNLISDDKEESAVVNKSGNDVTILITRLYFAITERQLIGDA